MSRPHVAGATIVVALVLSSFLLLVTTAQAQKPGDPNITRGLELYEKGDDREAITALRLAVKRQENDLSAWYYLGLALERQRQTGEARKAFEKPARLGDAVLSAPFEISTGDLYPRLLQASSPQLRQAAESATKYLQLAKPSKSKLDEWTARVAYLRDAAELSDANSSDPALRNVFKNRDVTTRARVVAKPEPRYTSDAREHQIIGTVVLRCIFAADGRVRAIFPVKSLPRGLTLASIRAAQQIKFVPATKDGRPVSVFMQVEYNFNL